MHTLKILLLQARYDDDPAKEDERRSFAARCGLSVEKIIPFDLLKATPTLSEVRRCDALMIGGSGVFYVSKRNLPGFEAVMELLREVTAVSHPTFASCFGFQLLAQALGGNIVYDPDCMEVGTYPVTMNEAGKQDELFRYFPETFNAQLGRKDRAAFVPKEVVNLAGSERAPFQAIRVPGKPIWGTQFHPELTREENLARFNHYQKDYASMMDEAEMQTALARFQESLETEELVGRFLRIVFG